MDKEFLTYCRRNYFSYDECRVIWRDSLAEVNKKLAAIGQPDYTETYIIIGGVIVLAVLVSWFLKRRKV
jgi:hypothetical protein